LFEPAAGSDARVEKVGAISTDGPAFDASDAAVVLLDYLDDAAGPRSTRTVRPFTTV
jgi:hypothetical protein